MLKGMSKKKKALIGTAVGACAVALAPVIGIPAGVVTLISTLGSLFGAS
jgi:hypothetical protein